MPNVRATCLRPQTNSSRVTCYALRMLHKPSLVAIALMLLGHLSSCAPEHGLAGPQSSGESSRTSLADAASEIEDILLTLLNQERARHSVPSLRQDPQLQEIARSHSAYMARKGQLSHTNNLGEGPTERAEKTGIRTVKRTGSSLRIGIIENVGFMPTGNVKGHGLIRSPRDVARAMRNEWLRSSSHRANMLNPEVTHVGIGAASDGQGAFYLTTDMR